MNYNRDIEVNVRSAFQFELLYSKQKTLICVIYLYTNPLISSKHVPGFYLYYVDTKTVILTEHSHRCVSNEH